MTYSPVIPVRITPSTPIQLSMTDPLMDGTIPGRQVTYHLSSFLELSVGPRPDDINVKTLFSQGPFRSLRDRENVLTLNSRCVFSCEDSGKNNIQEGAFFLLGRPLESNADPLQIGPFELVDYKQTEREARSFETTAQGLARKIFWDMAYFCTNPRIKQACLRALARMQDITVLEYIFDDLKRAPMNERDLINMIHIVGLCADSICSDWLITKLKNENTSEAIKTASIDALCQIKEKKALPHIIKIINTPQTSEKLQAQALCALGRLDCKNAYDLLMQKLSDETLSDHLRIAAGHGLLELGDRRALPKILEIIATTGQIRFKYGGIGMSPMYLARGLSFKLGLMIQVEETQALIRLISHPDLDASVCTNLVLALKELNTEADAPQLISILQNPSKDVFLKKAIVQVLARFNVKFPGLEASQILKADPEPSVESSLKILNDAEAGLASRFNALNALHQICDQEAFLGLLSFVLHTVSSKNHRGPVLDLRQCDQETQLRVAAIGSIEKILELQTRTA